MDIKKALNWLNSRFLSAKEDKYSSFKVKEVDFKAFNSVVRYVSISNKKKVSQNVLFAKLYIYHLNKMIEIYDTDVLEDIPRKELSKLLETPLDYFYQAFHNSLQNKWNDKMIEKIMQKHDISKEYVKEKYTLEFVENQLNLWINQSLNRFEE